MTDLNPYEEGLAADLAKAQGRIDDLTRRHTHALRKIDVLEDQIEKAVELISEKPILATYEDHVQWKKAALAELKGQDNE